jgi:hypothetical protein
LTEALFIFAIGVLESIAIYGKPNSQITQGIVFEIVLGAGNVFGIVNTLVF